MAEFLEPSVVFSQLLKLGLDLLKVFLLCAAIKLLLDEEQIAHHHGVKVLVVLHLLFHLQKPALVALTAFHVTLFLGLLGQEVALILVDDLDLTGQNLHSLRHAGHVLTQSLSGHGEIGADLFQVLGCAEGMVSRVFNAMLIISQLACISHSGITDFLDFVENTMMVLSMLPALSSQGRQGCGEVACSSELVFQVVFQPRNTRRDRKEVHLLHENVLESRPHFPDFFT
mmetsp:Transcript_32378/g.74819  ORF Transcript_32378/g.74819 Transcript_32378/m.74819 type:complete len:228 (-) Transcript_32378:282-965(-)